MSDSSDDEFVSASEGEEDDPPVKNKNQPIVNEQKEVKEESSEIEEIIDQKSDGDHEKEVEEPSIKEEHSQPDSQSIEDDSGKEEEKTKEEPTKEIAANDEKPIIPDVSSLKIEDDSEVDRKVSTSTSSESGKDKKEWEKVEEIEDSSLDEGKSGWDDWGVEDTVETKKVEPKMEPKPKVEPEPEEEEEEGGDGWDDWGNEEVTEPAAPAQPKKESSIGERKEEEKREELLSRLGGGKTGGSGWGWGGMLSGIGETFSSAVESSLGLPSAQELAKRHAEIEKMETPDSSHQEQPASRVMSSSQSQNSFGGFGMFSGIVTGGIDVLESIGKKTFETITVRKEEAGRRRFIFEPEKGENLSDVLRELRERNEAEAMGEGLSSSSPSSSRLPDMASSFERSDGMIHLEALELMATNRPKQKMSVHRQLLALLENARVDSVDGEEDFPSELRAAIKETGLPYSADGIVAVDRELESRLRSGDGKSSEELFKEGVDALVQFTAASVHLISKLASLLAVMGGSHFDPFVSIYRILSTRCTYLANLYMLAISASDEGTKADELGTQVLVESSTAIDFIRQAHALLIPIIEVK